MQQRQSRSTKITERRLSSSQPKSDELVFKRIRLNPVDRTNAAYHSRWPRSEVECYQVLAGGSRILWSDKPFRPNLGWVAIVPLDEGKQTNRTATRVPVACGLQLAWQLATHRAAELLAGDRG
jgi:hypothetical protein